MNWGSLHSVVQIEILWVWSSDFIRREQVAGWQGELASHGKGQQRVSLREWFLLHCCRGTRVSCFLENLEACHPPYNFSIKCEFM